MTGVSGFLIFLGVIAALCVAGLIISKKKGNYSVREFASIKKGVIIAICAIAALALLILAIKPVAAQERVQWLDAGGVFVGLFHPAYGGNDMFCQDKGTLFQLYGEVGIFAEIVRYGDASAQFRFEHNSCAFGSDAEDDNRLGVMFQYDLW